MKRNIVPVLSGALLAALFNVAFAATAMAQEAAPNPVVVVGNTQATLLFDKVTLAPGEHAEQSLDVSDFARLSSLAAAESGPNFGRVEVITRFGPPPVPVPNKLTLQFGGGTTARRADHMPVMGPNLTVGIANHSAQPVEVSLGVFASE